MVLRHPTRSLKTITALSMWQKVGKQLNKQEMCVTLEEHQFPVSLSYRMRSCKLFVAAEGVEAENLAQTGLHGSFSER